MNIMKRVKEYFSGEWGEPKFNKILPISIISKAQDEIETEKLVKQLKNVSEPTYMLAKAIDDGVVKIYVTASRTVTGLYVYYRDSITLAFPDKKVIKGSFTSYYNHARMQECYEAYLPSFNSEELEYLATPINQAIQRRRVEKNAKLQAVIDAKNAAIRNQITESLQTTK